MYLSYTTCFAFGEHRTHTQGGVIIPDNQTALYYSMKSRVRLGFYPQRARGTLQRAFLFFRLRRTRWELGPILCVSILPKLSTNFQCDCQVAQGEGSPAMTETSVFRQKNCIPAMELEPV